MHTVSSAIPAPLHSPEHFFHGFESGAELLFPRHLTSPHVTRSLEPPAKRGARSSHMFKELRSFPNHIVVRDSWFPPTPSLKGCSRVDGSVG
jgi:hypothetical protein